LLVYLANFGYVSYSTTTYLYISYNTVVTNITTDSNFVYITTENGTEIRGVAAIVTVPLGVLKYGNITFDPPLPDDKMDAIEQLDVSTLDTLWLNYEQIGTSQRVIIINQQNPINTTNENAWPVVTRSGFGNNPQNPGLLELRFGGGYAKQMETNTVTELANSANSIAISAAQLLSTAYPIGMQKTNFSTDPFFRGSFVATPPNTTLSLLDILAKNYSKTIFFAGEHTIQSAPATVHGAIISGIKAAVDVLNMPAQYDEAYSRQITPQPVIDISLSDWYSQDLLLYTDNIDL